MRLAQAVRPSGIRLGTATSTGATVSLAPHQLATHMQVIGGTGLGKSFFLEGIIKQLILDGRGVGVIDPHGDLYDRLIDFLVCLNAQQPELKLASRVIPFNIAETRHVLGFNPTARNARVMTYQVVALMEAIRKCWGQTSFEATPRLARWLFNTNHAVIESQTTLLQAYDMVDPKPNQYRDAIISRIADPRIKAEWEWIASLRPEKREERLESCFSRIRLFVTHELLRLIVGQYRRTLDFSSVLGGGKIFLVNLARQNAISEDDQHMLGTLLVNEILTAAFGRPKNKRPPFYLFIDEFQHFTTKDMCEILDGGRKFGLHLILAHQHLNQTKLKDPEVYYSALTNARIKAVFGGLIDEDLDVLARELYTGELNPDEIKDEIWAKRWNPVESSRVVYTDSWGSSSGFVSHDSLTSGTHYIPGSEFWSPGTHSYGSGAASGRSSQRGSYDAGSKSEVPFYEFHQSLDLTSRAFRQLEEQIYIKKAQLKRQSRQHSAILIPGKPVQLVKTPGMKDFSEMVNDSQREEFKQACFEAAGCFQSPEGAGREIAALQEKLLSESRIILEFGTDEGSPRTSNRGPKQSIWNRTSADSSGESKLAEQPNKETVPPAQRKRGPKPDSENHLKVARILKKYGDDWTSDLKLGMICEELDRQKVPVNRTWPLRKLAPARSWSRAQENISGLVRKALKDRVKMAKKLGLL